MTKIIKNFNKKSIIGSVIFSFAILMMIANSFLNQFSYSQNSQNPYGDLAADMNNHYSANTDYGMFQSTAQQDYYTTYCSNIGGTWDGTACNIDNRNNPTVIQEERCPSGQYRDPFNGLCYQDVVECKDYSTTAKWACSLGCKAADLICKQEGCTVDVSLCSLACQGITKSLECKHHIEYPSDTSFAEKLTSSKDMTDNKNN
jgi:hypothetical protein